MAKKKLPEPVVLMLVVAAMIVGAVGAKLTMDALLHNPPASGPPNYGWIIWAGFFAIFLFPAFFKALSRDSERNAEQLADEALAEAKRNEASAASRRE